MKKLNLLQTIIFILLFSVTSKNLFSQGLWDVNASNDALTTTNSNVGIGTLSPQAKLDLEFCPQSLIPGLLLSRKYCNYPVAVPHNSGGYVFSFDGIPDPGFGVEVGYPPGTWNIAYYGYSYDLLPFGASGNILQNEHPLIWARTENDPFIPGTSGPYTTQFMVTPYGRTGVNVESPRSTFDIKSLGGYNFPALIVGRQKPGSADKTQHMQYIPFLSVNGYNRISKQGDQGIFFTDGGGGEGANVSGSFVIAPWAENNSSLVGGLRMDNLGNIELRGELRSTRIKVDAKWWPDFVFDYSYQLMPLSEVKEFINKNKHLPNIPNQDSVMNSGQDIGELQKLQQQKIEELTLYTIQQQELIDNQNEELLERIKQLEEVKDRLKKLEEQINRIVDLSID